MRHISNVYSPELLFDAHVTICAESQYHLLVNAPNIVSACVEYCDVM